MTKQAKKDLTQLAIIWVLAVAMGIFAFWYINSQIAHALPAKGDDPCTGLETAGRCSDKCPEGNYEIGREANGAAICKPFPTGCPYGENIPLDSPKCAPSADDVYNQNQTTEPAPAEQFVGK